MKSNFILIPIFAFILTGCATPNFDRLVSFQPKKHPQVYPGNEKILLDGSLGKK